MSKCTVKLIKTIDTIVEPLATLKLTLMVTESVGIPATLFVHRYFPKSPYSGSEEYEFYNVAYPDEFSSVSDKLINPRNACYLRTNKVVKIFKDQNALDEFMSIVLSDLSRLVKYFETFDQNADTCSNSIMVSADGVVEYPTVVTEFSKQPSDDISTDSTEATKVTDDLNTDSAETIIVDITGK